MAQAHTSVAAPHFAEGDFRVGSVIRRSASMLSVHFFTFFIVTVIAHSPIILLARSLTMEPMDLGPVDLAVRLLGWGVLGLVQLIVLGALGEAVIVHAAFQDMQRRPVRLAESLNVALRRFLPIVGVAFVVVLLIRLVGGVAFFVVLSVAFVMVLSMPQEYQQNLGLILLIVPGLILYAMWFVAVPACVVERLGPWTSLRRSRDLTKGHRWKLCGLALLPIVPNLGITFGLATAAGPIVGPIITWFGTAIWAAFAAVVGAVTYHDLRVVKDIEQITDVFD
jgi:hypothetical protein